MIVLYPYEVGDGVCITGVGPRGLLNREVGYPPTPLSLLNSGDKLRLSSYMYPSLRSGNQDLLMI